MSPTKIEWTDETINPQGWGCWGPGGTPEEPRRCWYCYAHRMARRNLRDCPECREFIPHWHPEVFEKLSSWRKPRRIFWQSMGDLFHPQANTSDIEMIIGTAKMFWRHTHIFLTKNPSRYADYNPWPENCWLLTTLTNQADDWRVTELFKARAPVLGVSVEPMLGSVDLIKAGALELYTSWDDRIEEWEGINWLIIGALTGFGSKHHPKPEHVQSLIDQGRAAGVPVFLKDNLHWPTRIQEWPG